MKNKPISIQEKVNVLLEQKVEEISSKMGEELTTKDIDVLIKLANLREKIGGRPVLAASIAIVEELLAFLQECDDELGRRLEEHLEGFFSRMRSNYE